MVRLHVHVLMSNCTRCYFVSLDNALCSYDTDAQIMLPSCLPQRQLAAGDVDDLKGVRTKTSSIILVFTTTLRGADWTLLF